MSDEPKNYLFLYSAKHSVITKISCPDITVDYENSLRLFRNENTNTNEPLYCMKSFDSIIDISGFIIRFDDPKQGNEMNSK